MELFSGLHTAEPQSEMEQLLQVLVEGQKAQREINAALLQQQARANQLKEQELQQTKSSPRASHFISKLGVTDDVEAYLHAFEATAAREGWAKTQWVGLVAPFLSGEALKAFRDVEMSVGQDYDKLKEEILSRQGLTKFSLAQRFHEWTFQTGATPRAQMHELTRVANRWLDPGKNSPAAIVEVLLMDRYLRALPFEAKKVISQQRLTTTMQLVEAVEQYQASMDMLRLTRKEPTATAPVRRSGFRPGVFQQGSSPASSQRRVLTPFQQQQGSSNPEPRQCFRCGKVGHISWQCDKPDEPMPTAASSNSQQANFAALLGESVDCRPTCPVTVNQCEVEALLDSGSARTLVQESVLEASPLAQSEHVPVVCVHGDTREYPTARVRLKTTKGTFNIEVGVIKSLPVPVLIGRDCPAFSMLWKEAEKRRKPEPRKRRSLVTKVNKSWVNPSKPWDSPSVVAQVFAADSSGGDSEPEETADSELQPGPSVDEAEDVEAKPPLKGQFGTAQIQDPTLNNALKNVQVVEGTLVGPRLTLSFPHFAVKNGLLYQVIKYQDKVLDQLLVPKPHRSTVMQLAHTHILGAHLGVEKTKERILQRFFWPGIHREVENFCRSCPECQVTAPKPRYKSPLIPLPIIETPFEKVGLDIVGPLPKSARGHQYILVLVDYATRYPEAIPLRKANARQIANELFLFSTRVGLPKEILTDQGSPFMSRVMRQLCALLRVKQVRTSVYHPQTDGLVERFNKTLKAMLRKAVGQDGRNWDQLIPYLLFAVREVPQSSTGFSPFDLLYSHKPRGLLDIARETWEEQPCPHWTMIEHVTAMRKRMAAIFPIVKEHMEKAQRDQRAVYDRTAQPREFQPGDRVLVLVPTVECKFLATWQGPYEVVEKVGEVNYKIRQPGKRKGEQIYHVNLLKKWHDRETLFTGCPPKEPEDLAREVVHFGPELSPHQLQQAKELVDRNQDVFSSLPGCTHLVEHEVRTQAGKTVNQRPYRVPEARRKVIEEEVSKMLKLNVIEESKSAWSSPIVLVAKPDNTVRFCNDFRKLNAVSEFDAYPMPRVDELIESLGNARFITTLDLTKGYWQVPLAAESKEKTAFATPGGLWQYRMLPFGLSGAPATFQRLMDQVLKPHKEYAAAYLDDVVIQSPDWDSHLPRVEKVLESIREAGLTANPKKCKLAYSETNYLGYTIGRGLVKPQEAKLDAIQKWPKPLTKKQVRSFLGLANYYRRFIPDFAGIAAPLTELTTKKHSRMVKWSPEAEEAFGNLKRALCSKPVLMAPNFSKEFVVQADASEVGLGAVLSQIHEGEEHPVLYLSRKLLPRERNYATVEKEGLAIKWALETLRYYLLGRRFTLVTDHAPLQWMAKNKESNSRVTRWFLGLQPFNFSVIHRPGRTHGNADALSRRDAFWSSFTLPRTSGPRGGMCGITRGRVVEGRYVPLPEWLPRHKMAAGKTTSPRMHFSDRCKCLSPLIEAGAQVWERERTKEQRHTPSEGHRTWHKLSSVSDEL